MNTIKKYILVVSTLLIHLSSPVTTKAAARTATRASDFLLHPLPAACRTEYATELGLSRDTTIPDIGLICGIHPHRVKSINEIVSKFFIGMPSDLIKTIILPFLYSDYSKQILNTRDDKHYFWDVNYLGSDNLPNHLPIKTIAWENSSDETPHLVRLQVKEGLIVYFFNKKNNRPRRDRWNDPLPTVIAYTPTEACPDSFNAVRPEVTLDRTEQLELLGKTTIDNPHVKISCPHLIVDPFLQTKVLLAWVIDHDEHPHGGTQIQVVVVEKSDLEHLAREIENYHTRAAEAQERRNDTEKVERLRKAFAQIHQAEAKEKEKETHRKAANRKVRYIMID